MQNMRKKCCSTGYAAPLLSIDKKDATCKDASAVKIFNEYLLIKYQSSKTRNDITLTDSKLKKGLGKGAVN
jgi:hypothetical protein